MDSLGLYTSESYQKVREQVILRQQQDMLELSTPVVSLWDGIIALPIIGTLDSERSQVVMESLLNKIVETGSEIEKWFTFEYALNAAGELIRAE